MKKVISDKIDKPVNPMMPIFLPEQYIPTEYDKSVRTPPKGSTMEFTAAQKSPIEIPDGQKLQFSTPPEMPKAVSQGQLPNVVSHGQKSFETTRGHGNEETIKVTAPKTSTAVSQGRKTPTAVSQGHENTPEATAPKTSKAVSQGRIMPTAVSPGLKEAYGGTAPNTPKAVSQGRIPHLSEPEGQTQPESRRSERTRKPINRLIDSDWGNK